MPPLSPAGRDALRTRTLVAIIELQRCVFESEGLTMDTGKDALSKTGRELIADAAALRWRASELIGV